MAKKDNSALAWLIGLGTLTVAGIGIYFYEKSQPAAPTTAPGSTGATLLAPTASQLTPAQAAALAASFAGTTLAAWQASGIPTATYNSLSPLAQSGVNAAGIHQV